jgi:hypothetical protein
MPPSANKNMLAIWPFKLVYLSPGLIMLGLMHALAPGKVANGFKLHENSFDVGPLVGHMVAATLNGPQFFFFFFFFFPFATSRITFANVHLAAQAFSPCTQ